MLPLRELGTTGLRVSALGLGTVKLGRNTGLKYPAPFELPTDAAAADLLRAAQRVGVTLLDTAPAYGVAEERIGRIIGACGGRDRWTIVTKAGEEFDAVSGVSSFDFSPGTITASVERSLKRLRTDRVELLLIHSDGRDEWILRESGAPAALAKLKKQGKIRAAGISTKTPEGALLAVRGDPAAGVAPMNAVMLTLNPAYALDRPAIDACEEQARAGGPRPGVLIKKALESGRTSADAVRTSLSLCLSRGCVSSVLIGTLNPEHLESNARAAMSLLADQGAGA